MAPYCRPYSMLPVQIVFQIPLSNAVVLQKAPDIIDVQLRLRSQFRSRSMHTFAFFACESQCEIILAGSNCVAVAVRRSAQKVRTISVHNNFGARTTCVPMGPPIRTKFFLHAFAARGKKICTITSYDHPTILS